jgi:hypothetical protein
MKCFSPIGLTDNKRIANTAHRNVSKKRHARTLSMSWRTSEARDTWQRRGRQGKSTLQTRWAAQGSEIQEAERTTDLGQGSKPQWRSQRACAWTALSEWHGFHPQRDISERKGSFPRRSEDSGLKGKSVYRSRELGCLDLLGLWQLWSQVQALTLTTDGWPTFFTSITAPLCWTDFHTS